MREKININGVGQFRSKHRLATTYVYSIGQGVALTLLNLRTELKSMFRTENKLRVN